MPAPFGGKLNDGSISAFKGAGKRSMRASNRKSYRSRGRRK